MATEPLKPKKEKKYFFRDFRTELKKVIWPTPKQLANNTIAVLTIVIIVAIIVCILDFAFDKMNHYGIEGIKRLIQNVEDAEDSESSAEGAFDLNNIYDEENTNELEEPDEAVE